MAVQAVLRPGGGCRGAAPPCGRTADTVGGLLCCGGQALRAAAIESPRLEARLLLGHVAGLDAAALLRDPRRVVPAATAARFAALVERRAAREPLAHLTGEQGFWSLSLEVSPATLIPRPDSETLIEAALAAFPDPKAVRSVLDLGTGTGCLLLAALTEFCAATGVGVDLVPAAAALARRNAQRLGLADRVLLLAGAWGAALGAQFDLVLCNPPYIASADIAGLDPEVARHEPGSALDGGADGLDAYRQVLAELPRLLAPGGRAVLELGAGQAVQVTDLASALGLRRLDLHRDLGGVERALVLAA